MPKAKAKDQYVLVLPGNTEHFVDLGEPERWESRSKQLEDAGSAALRKAGIKTSRKNPVVTKIEVFKLEIKNGQLERRAITTISVQPQLEQMTYDEYNKELVAAVDGLPEPFKHYVRSEAWDRGHSAGYEEVINYATSMAFDLRPVIEQYRKELLAEKTPA